MPADVPAAVAPELPAAPQALAVRPPVRDAVWADGAAQVAVLEVLEGDHVVQRHRLDALPLRVGRGYGNHVILDDPKVSARHLTVERREDGALVVRDAGSRNGTYRLEARGRATRLVECAPADDTRLALGDTVLRFRSEDHPVCDTLVSEAPGPLPPRRFESRAVAGLALLAAAGTGALTTHLESPERPDGGRLMLEAVVPVLLVVLWAGAWSLGTRAARRRFHAVAHAAVAAVALTVMGLLPRGLGALAWGLGWTEAWLVAGPVVVMGVAGWALYWHLRYLTRLRPRGLAAGLGLIVAGLALLLQLGAGVGDEDFVSAPQFSRTLHPPALQLAAPRPVDAFVDGLDALQEQADAAAREAPAD